MSFTGRVSLKDFWKLNILKIIIVWQDKSGVIEHQHLQNNKLLIYKRIDNKSMVNVEKQSKG